MRKKIFSISKIIAIAGICITCISTSASASSTYGFNEFKNAFHNQIGAPPGSAVLNQQVAVLSNATESAYAICDYFKYTGNVPILTIQSADSSYPTTSVSFTSSNIYSKEMRYRNSIPVYGRALNFQGKVTNYEDFTIKASVKG